MWNWFPFSFRQSVNSATKLALTYLFLWFCVPFAPSSCLFLCAVSKHLTLVYITLVNTSDNFIEDSAFLLCSLSAKYWTKLFQRLLFKSRHQKMHMLPPDRLYRMQSKLDLSWPSSCLYTITLAFPCINWVFKNSLKNVLFWKKNPKPNQKPNKKTPRNIFIWDAYFYLKFRFLSIYILPGHTFKFLQGSFFHTLSKAEWK